MAHVCHGFLAGSKGSADAKQHSLAQFLSVNHHTFKHIEIYIYLCLYMYIYTHAFERIIRKSKKLN